MVASLGQETRKPPSVRPARRREQACRRRPTDRPLAMQCDPKNDEDHCPPAAWTSDFNTHRVARIRFPAQREHWRLCGHMFSSRFLFPAYEHDDSQKQLLETAVRDILKAACMSHGLDQGTMGAVYAVAAD